MSSLFFLVSILSTIENSQPSFSYIRMFYYYCLNTVKWTAYNINQKYFIKFIYLLYIWGRLQIVNNKYIPLFQKKNKNDFYYL